MSAFAAIIGTSTVIRHVQHLVVKVADLDTPVMITGEPGSGKEHVARAIHEKSARHSGSFIPIKCSSFSEELLEVELFGLQRENGTHRPGRFEVATGGTVFLDEISKFGPKIQAQVLRLMVDGIIVPVGGNRPINVNTRVICASIYSLDNLVRERALREELYYRLASCSVYIPPLRERREDIPLLVDFFIEKCNQVKGKNISGVSADAMTALLQHEWTHNIRELENLIERIVILKNSGSVEVCDLPPRLRNFVTDNIDNFYERLHPNRMQNESQRPTRTTQQQSFPTTTAIHPQANLHMNIDTPAPKTMNTQQAITTAPYNNVSNQNQAFVSQPNRISTYEESSDIDQFIKKDIDLGNGIDFYRVVEEFENKLISEALRRTNHNKNRAAQLLSMNRTTLVEKLKKRTTTTTSKTESHRVKRNSAFTIFDSLGAEESKFSSADYMTKEDTGDILDLD